MTNLALPSKIVIQDTAEMFAQYSGQGSDDDRSRLLVAVSSGVIW